jgi:hypothetical protein
MTSQLKLKIAPNKAYEIMAKKNDMPSSSLEIKLPLETNASLLLTFPLDNVAVKMCL